MVARKEVMPVYIYALCEPDTWERRYVGKTVLPLFRRFTNHVTTARRRARLPVHRWLNKQIAAGAPYAIELIEVVTEGCWREREQHWISQVCGSRSLNVTAGGEGLHGHTFTPEHKDKIAAALRRGVLHECDRCATPFHRKPKDAKSPHLFCSRACYQVWQRGKAKRMPSRGA